MQKQYVSTKHTLQEVYFTTKNIQLTGTNSMVVSKLNLGKATWTILDTKESFPTSFLKLSKFRFFKVASMESSVLEKGGSKIYILILSPW